VTLFSAGDLIAGSRLLAALPPFLRRPVSLEQARQTLIARFERRVSDFLQLAEHGIFRNPMSPYRTLLRMAGCERVDLERMVRQDGLEGALSRLYRAGVYLTVAELKGREPVRRGSSQFTLQGLSFETRWRRSISSDRAAVVAVGVSTFRSISDLSGTTP
jgi:hypothetical protein